MGGVGLMGGTDEGDSSVEGHLKSPTIRKSSNVADVDPTLSMQPNPNLMKIQSMQPAGMNRLTRPNANAIHNYGVTNVMNTLDNDKLGELHMRLNALLQIPVKKIKSKERNKLATQG